MSVKSNIWTFFSWSCRLLEELPDYKSVDALEVGSVLPKSLVGLLAPLKRTVAMFYCLRARAARLLLSASVALVGVGFALPGSVAPVVQAAPVHRGSAELLLKNASSVWVTLYVGGQGCGSIPPGDQQPVQVSVGYHNLRVKILDGTNRYITRNNAYIGPNGVTWTITN